MDAMLEAHLSFAGAPFWTQRYAFAAFDRVTVRPEKSGTFVSAPVSWLLVTESGVLICRHSPSTMPPSLLPPAPPHRWDCQWLTQYEQG